MHTRTTLSPCKNKNDRRSPRPRRIRASASAPAALTFAVSLSFGSVPLAIAGPTGGVVVGGQGSISRPNAATTVVNQSSNLLQLNWNTFNVNQGESVQFRQPSSTSVAFNRILDQNPSQIFGQIQGNGQVVLVNPNGLLIGRTAQLNVNSLVVSSLSDMGYDPVSGRYRFSSAAANPGAVINQGTITAGHGGSVTLLGGTVSNSGTIVADYGTVNLAAGRVATLDLAGDGLLRLEVGSELSANSSGAASAVQNSGTISASGGQVVLSASAIKDVFTNLVNNTGVVRANRIDNSGGTIELLGTGGDVTSSGTLDASAGDAKSTGGTVTMSGERVGLFGSATVDVSGATGGGTAFIGGGDHGSNPDVPNAQQTVVSSGATIDADAGMTGDGGHVVVWSDDFTSYGGNLSARGGSLSGNGGYAEVSGKQSLAFTGGADLTAEHGTWGTLLLDPQSLTINHSSADPGAGTYLFTDNPTTDETVGDATVNSLLSTADVQLQGKNFLTTSNNSAITATGSHSLELDSQGPVLLQGSISLQNGAVKVTTDGTSGAGTITMATGSTVSTTGAVSLTAASDVTLTAVTGGSVSVNTSGNIAAGTGNLITATSTGVTLSGTAVGANGTPVNTAAGSLTATATGGGIFVSDSGALNLTGTATGDLNVMSVGDLTVVGTVSSAGQLSLTSSTGSILEGTGGQVTDTGAAVPGVTLSGTAIGTNLSPLTTSAGSLNATSTAGEINVGDLGALSLTASATGGPIFVTSAGDMTVGSVSSDGQVQLQSQNGAIKAGSGNLVSGTTVVLVAQTAVGQVTSFAAGSGTPINVSASTQAEAEVFDTSAAGTINVNLAGPNFPTILNPGDFALGLGSVGNGTVIVQKNGAFDLTGTTGLVSLGGGGNTASVGLISTGALTLPSSGVDTDFAPKNLLLQGTDVLAAVGSHTLSLPISGNLIFNSGGGVATSITTDASHLDAVMSGGAALTVSESAAPLTVGTVLDNAGAVSITTSGSGNSLTVANTGSVGGVGVTLGTTGATAPLTVSGAVNGGGGGVSLTTAATGSDLDINAAVSAIAAVQLQTTASNINLGSTVTATGAAATIEATSGGSIVANAGNQVTATGMTLQGTAIGANGAALNTTAGTGTLAATGGAGGIFVSDSGPLTLNASTSAGGAIQAQAGTTLTVTSASGGNVTLNSGGTNNDLAVNGTVTASGLAQLTSTGAITAQNATDVISGTTGVHLSAQSGIGTVTSFATLAGAPVSVSTSGTLTASTTSTGGTINLNVTGAPTVASDGIELGTSGSATGTVVLQSASGSVDLANLAANAIRIGAGNTASVGLSSPTGILTLPTAALTDVAPQNLLVQGGTDVVGSGGSRTLSLTASGDVDFIAGALGAATTLNVTASRLDALISAPATLTVNSGAVVPFTLGSITDTGGVVSVDSIAPGSSFSSAAGTTVTADQLGLSAVSLGTSSQRIQTAVNTLTVNAFGGSAYIQQQSGALGVSGTASGTIDVLSAGALTSGATSAPSGVVLKTTGAGANLVLNGVVSATAGPVSLTTTGSASDIDVNAGVTSGGMTTLDATGNAAISAAINSTGAASVTAGSAITAGTGNQITANGLQLQGTSIGAGNAPLNTHVGTLSANTSGAIDLVDSGSLTLTASATGGSVNVQASSLNVTSATGTGATLIAAGTGGIGGTLNVAGPVSGGNADVTLTASGAGGLIDIGGAITNTTQVTATAGTPGSPGIIASTGGSVSTGTFTATGAVVGNTTPIATSAPIVVATANVGGIDIHGTGASLNLTANANGTGGVQVTSDGPMTVTSVNGADIALTTNGVGNDLTVSGLLATPGVAQLTSSGAITTGAGDTISGTAGVTLSAATGIGTVTNFTTLAGAPANVATSGNLAAAVSSDAGQINLNLVGSIPTFAGAGAISLGSGAGVRTGTVVLQSAGDLNVASLPAGAISIGTGNAASLGFSSGGTLTLPAIGGFTDAPAQNLSVQGTHDVVSSGGADPRQLSISAQDLSFTSGSAGGPTTLNTSVSQLNASIGNSAQLTVNQTGVTPLTLGAITDTGPVSITSTGAIVDDGNPATVIAASNLALSGTALGATGAPIQTLAANVSANASTGDVYLQQGGALTLSANAPGGQVSVQTSTGGLTVTSLVSGAGASLTTAGSAAPLVLGSVNAGTGPLILTTSGAGSDIGIGTLTTTGAATVQATGAIDTGAGNSIAANGLTVTAASIGSSTVALSSHVGNLAATSTNGGIYVSDSGPLSLTASATGGPVDVQTSGGPLTVASAAGNGINLATTFSGGALTLNGPLNAGGGAVSLAASGAIDTSGATISASTLTATGASIGAAGSALNTNASSVTATAANGGIDLQDSGSLTLAANATGAAVQASAGGSLTVTSASGTDITLTASGAGNTLSLDGPIDATGTAQLTSPGAILAGTGNQLSASDAILRGTVIGAIGAPVNTTLGALDVASANGGIFIVNTDAVTLTAAATNGAVNVQSTGGSMTVSSASGNGVTLGTGGTGSALTVSSGGINGHAGDVSLTTTGATSDITLNGAVTTTGKIAIDASGDGSNVVLNVPLSSPTDISITAGSAASAGNILTGAGTGLSAPSIELVGAEIGGSAATLNTTGATLSATSRNGGIFIDSTGALVLGAINGGTGPVSITASGAITAATGVTLTGGAFTVVGTSLGSATNPLSTAASSLTTTSTNGGTFIDEADAVTLNSSATGGPLNVQTTNGAITVGAASANGVTLTAGGAGSGITVNGLIAGGSGGVALKAGGSVVEGAGGSVTGSSLTATAASIGSASAALSTNVPTLTADATAGGVYVTNQGALNVQSVQASGDAAVSALSGDLTIGTLTAGGSASLTAGSGAIVDASGNSTPLTATGVTLLADSIGAASSATGSGPFTNLRLIISASTLNATSTAGGVYIDALNGLASASVHASGGFNGNIELVAPNGNLNLMSVSASSTLLLSAGLNIFGLPGMTPITAQSAELRAGDSDPTAGHIGSLTQPLELQLNAGNTLKIFVPSTIDTHDATRAPATLPSSGVTTTLTLFGAPSLLALEAGFGQFQGLDNGTLYTSQAESLVRSIQNQTTVVQNVVGLDWSSFDPNVSLFGTLDPPVCMPPDQRDEEQGKAGC